MAPWIRLRAAATRWQKFDVEGKFIRKYLPVLEKLPLSALHRSWLAQPVELTAAGVELGQNYPLPLVPHAEARALALQRYAVVKKPCG
ncbi:MAG: FAD-binding domain-containing protein [Polaromonas sp.]